MDAIFLKGKFMFKIIGMIDKKVWEVKFDSAKEVEMVMRDIDKRVEEGVFKNVYFDVEKNGVLLRKYEWI